MNMNCCKDCNKKISRRAKRCLSCCRSGKNNYGWKGGLPSCLDCGKKVSHTKVKRCFDCNVKFQTGKKKKSGINLAEKNGNWKGRSVDYKEGLHSWIKRRKLKPKKCVICKKNSPYDLANISGKYKRDINDFQYLCRSCHMKQDGRINNLKQYQGL